MAIRLARGKHFLLLNSDCIILDDSVQRTLEVLKQAENVGMIGCKLLNRDGTLQRSCSRFLRPLTPMIGRQCVAEGIARESLPRLGTHPQPPTWIEITNAN